MNKKYLSVVLFGALMLGAAGTFTGCIDNDEPAGIENLRGAKAELLKAKAAVEYAREAYKRAEAAWMQAKAQEQELLNKGIELGNKKLELELKVQEAKTEADIDGDDGRGIHVNLTPLTASRCPRARGGWPRRSRP